VPKCKESRGAANVWNRKRARRTTPKGTNQEWRATRKVSTGGAEGNLTRERRSHHKLRTLRSVIISQVLRSRKQVPFSE